MLPRLAVSLALAVALPALASPPADAATRAAAAYKAGRGEAVLRLETACWRGASRDTVASCAHLLLAGGVIDAARQRAERRGPIPAFAPDVQRQRFFAETDRLGLARPDAQAVLERAVRDDLPLIVQALAGAGM